MVETLRVRLLGGLEVEGVESRALGSRKGRRLLALLALTPGIPVPPDRIVDVVWGERMPTRPADQVSVLVSRLRGAVGAERLPRVDAGYVLHLDWLDLAALRELVGDAERRLAARSWSAARTAATAALALFRGPLLPEEVDATWCEPDRIDALRLAGRARLAAANAALAAGDLVVAADLSRVAVEADPYDEAALRLHLTACVAAGRPASALSAYAKARALLRDELGASPAPETEAVYAAVLAERIPAGYVVGRDRPEPGVGVPPLNLPGRSGELALLDSALARAAAGETLVVVIEGEAGIGKSRLLADWVAAREPSATMLVARCDELGRAVPLQPLLDAISGHLRGQPVDVTARLLGDEAVLLAPLLTLASPGSAPAAVPPGEGIAQTVLHAALRSLVERLTADRPAVLALDDGHLADEATAGWLRLMRRRSDLPLLVVVTRRQEEGPRIEADQVIALGPIDRAAAELAVGADRAAVVYDRSQGHPLFLVELAAAAADEDLPTSLRDSIAERCARAGTDVAATIRAAAVIDPEVDLDLLAAVLDRSPVELLDHLEDAARRRLIEERGTTFVFHHALIREALAQSTGAARRALLHREAARVLDARAQAQPLAVAYHARLGGDRALAARALDAAATVATQRYDYDEAVRLLDEAVDLDDNAALRRHRAHALIRASRLAEAAVDAASALAADPCAASYDVASLAAYLGPQRDFSRALALADEGARIATNDAERASCLAAGGRIAMAIGDLDGVDDRLRRAGSGAASAAARSTISFMTGAVAYQRGDYLTADRVLQAAQATSAPDHGWPTHVIQFRALALAGMGRPLAALALLDEQDDVARRLQIHRVAGRADNCRGYVLRGLGELDAADECNRIGLERAASAAQAEAQSHALLDLADGCLVRGDLDGAADFLQRAAQFRDIEHAMRWRHVLRGTLLTGRLALADGRADDAAHHAAQVLAEATPRGVLRYELFGRLLAAQAEFTARRRVDEDAVAEDLAGLDAVAGLEAWRWTHDLAVAAGIAPWHAWAGHRVSRLIDAAGPHADALRRLAARALPQG